MNSNNQMTNNEEEYECDCGNQHTLGKTCEDYEWYDCDCGHQHMEGNDCPIDEEEEESCDCCHYVFENDCKRKYYTETGTFCKACLEKQPCEDEEDE